MIGLLTLVLIVALFSLWSRVQVLERRISALELRPAVASEAEIAPTLVQAPAPPARESPARVVHSASPWAAPPPAPKEPAPPPVIEPEPGRQPRKIGFEELFGSRLPIWAGGITLAVAGLFIVKYSIDAGLLSPAVRIILGLLFATGLVVSAEVARHWKATAIDPRIAQALAGAGIAAAYSSILMATNIYHLFGPATGFLGLAAITAGALGLALRFGAPSAILGMVGGLAAPALIGETTDNIAPLTLYLGIVVAGLSLVARRQRWPCLNAAALAGGFGWSALIFIAKPLHPGNATALGGYALLLALAIPIISRGSANDRLLRMAAAFIGAIQIALIVARGGYAMLEWGLYGLLSIGVIVLAKRDRQLSLLPPLALAVFLATMLGWHQPIPINLLLVTCSAMLLFCGVALFSIWGRDGTLRDALQASAALGGGLGVASLIAPAEMLSREGWSLLALAVALPLAAAAIIGARHTLPERDPRLLILLTTVAILVCAAIPGLFPDTVRPSLFALGIAGLIELWLRRTDIDFRGATAVTLLALLFCIAAPICRWLLGTLLTLAGEPLFATALPRPLQALTAMLIPAAILGLSFWRCRPIVPSLVRHALLVGTATVIAAGLFIFYKQIFAIGDLSGFTASGLAERLLLDTILFGIGAAALAFGEGMPGIRTLGLSATAIAIARTLLFNCLLFNPLWRHQLVGTLPLVNLLVPAFLLPLGWVALARRREPLIATRIAPLLTGLQMALVTLFAASCIRQFFHGSLLAVGGVAPAENVAMSLAAIGLAIGFLRWGIFTRERPWRIASLLLMLAAVIKVFAVDAAGLEGLLRIASFAALGFSLIGIGWIYSRHLKADLAIA